MKLSSHDEVCEVDTSAQRSVKFKSSESVWWFENLQPVTKPLLFKNTSIFFHESLVGFEIAQLQTVI